MAAPEQLNTLAVRKRLLVEEAGEHRELISAERQTLGLQIGSVGERVWAHRWWVLAGAVGVGVLVMRIGAPRLIPAGLLAWQVAQRARGR